MKKHPLPPLSLLSLVLLSLSSCSSYSHLKREAENYSHSSYVNDVLQQKEVVTTTGDSAEKPVNSQLTALQKQLQQRQHKARSNLRTSILHNGLYTPPDTLFKQAKQQNHPESWLQHHNNLSAVLTLALARNPDIQSRLQEAQASLAKYDQISFLDDTLAQYAAFTRDLNVPVGKQKHKPSVNNGFPFPGLLGLKASIIDQAVESSRLQLKQTVQDTLTQTRITWYELQLAHQELGIIAEKIHLLQSLKSQLKDNYSNSSSELNAILEADIEIEKSRNQRYTTQNRLTSRQARLNALLNLSSDFKLKQLPALRPIKLPKSKQDTRRLTQTALRQRTEIARLQTEIKKMAQIIQLSEKRFYPDFSAGYSRFQNQTTTQTGSNASKAAFSTRPAFGKRNFFATNDAYLTETRLKYKALQAKLAALKNSTADEVQQTLANYNSQKNTWRLYQNKVIPQSRTTLNVTKNLFETGEASYVNVINIQKMILDYRLLSLQAIKEMNKQSARLFRLLGEAQAPPPQPSP